MRFALASMLCALLAATALLLPSPSMAAGADETLARIHTDQFRSTSEKREFGHDLLPPNFHFSRKKGIEYSRVFLAGDTNLSLRIWGPIVKKRPGIGFEVRDLRFLNYPVRLKGFANTKRARLIMSVRF